MLLREEKLLFTKCKRQVHEDDAIGIQDVNIIMIVLIVMKMTDITLKSSWHFHHFYAICYS